MIGFNGLFSFFILFFFLVRDIYNWYLKGVMDGASK